MVWFWLEGGSYWFFKFVFKRRLRQARPIRKTKLWRNNLANIALRSLQHFHCFLQQQTRKVRLQNVFPFSSPTLAPFLPFLRAHLFAEVKLLHPLLWMELANHAAVYLVPGSGRRRYEVGFEIPTAHCMYTIVAGRHCLSSPARVFFSHWGL